MILPTASSSKNGSLTKLPRFWTTFRQNRLAFLGFIIISTMVFLSFMGPVFNSHDPDYINILNTLSAPLSAGHLLGTDELGRDVLARLMFGGQISLGIGLAAMALSVILGTAVGMIAGYRGGVIGTVLMRLVDAVMAFPTIFLILALALLINPGVVSTTLLIAFTSWMSVARLVEGQFRSLRNAEYAAAARTMGVSEFRIMISELLPNAFGPIIVIATLNVARAILLESYVSFLGYGIQAPVASWGNMLNNSQLYMTSAPWLAILPGLAITLTVTSFNFIGEGLRSILEPNR